MLVRFNDQDEFVADLARDPHAVARKLVRTTTLRYPVMNGVLTRLAVVGTAKVISEAPGAAAPAYDIVELTEYSGDLWGHGDADNEVIEKAARSLAELENKLRDAGFVVSAGRYVVEESKP